MRVLQTSLGLGDITRPFLKKNFLSLLTITPQTKISLNVLELTALAMILKCLKVIDTF